MSRRRAAEKKQHLPDVRYGSLLVSKFINNIMIHGKKSVAEKIVYEALDYASEKMGLEQMVVFEQAISNVAPDIEVKSRRVGGATYQVPIEVSVSRASMLAMRWIIKAAKSKKAEKTMVAKLAALFADSYNNRGEAVKKRDDTHKMAEANRAFIHFKW